MPPTSSETLLIIIAVAIGANLLLGIALLIAPRLRRRDRTRPETQGSGRDFVHASSVSAERSRSLVPLFGAGPSTGAAADPQTGLELAGTWNRWLREEEARARRYRRPATIVLVEIEGLDRLVERLGPEAADRLIPPVAATMRRHAREADRVARLGPGRFGALLPETDEVQAINYVERIRSTCDLWLAAGAVALRLSLGWAESNANRSMELAVQQAEDRLNAERHRDELRDLPTPPISGAPATRPAPAS